MVTLWSLFGKLRLAESEKVPIINKRTQEELTRMEPKRIPLSERALCHLMLEMPRELNVSDEGKRTQEDLNPQPSDP